MNRHVGETALAEHNRPPCRDKEKQARLSNVAPWT